MPAALDEKLAPHLCEFVASERDNANWCEECHETIPEGGKIYFFSDGGYEPRDGTYTCRACAVKIVNGVEDRPLTPPEQQATHMALRRSVRKGK